MAEERADGFSSNGMYPEGVIGIADAAETELPASDDEATSADTPSADASASSADTNAEPDFLAELAVAMRATAANERKRIDEDTDRRREAHLETIRGRRESEAEKMRELAADDLKAIDEWAAGERQRIDQEREQRAAALQDDLEKSLAEHGTQIDGEIEGVEGAIAGYRTEVETFFGKLDAETDPVEFARLARLRPVFPDLALVPAAASAAAAAADAGPVGVMDAETAADPASAWSQWNATTQPLATAEVEPTATPTPSSLLQSVAVSRPYANLIGDSTDDQ
jgi:hypothetical protein